MNRFIKLLFTLIVLLWAVSPQFAQEITEKTFSGLKFRSLGPAFTSGRIADIAIHPINENIWYVAVGSGGVWKTENAGTTWKSLFDKEVSYSIGCVTIDPNDPATIWVGTGEDVGGRHVGFGDGVYVSHDGGSSWTNMGLKESQHIARIRIHPINSNIIWVAAQGPLWNKGGDRGIYKSTDGGKTWDRTLGDAEWVGATDLVIDPRNPDLMYAATWQRHRNVAAYMGGGPGTGIHRSRDGGVTWEELTNGIPKSNKGKIGLAISYFNPDVVYAAIELDRKTGGVFMSTNNGSSWVKQSDAVSGATGPHYYQELFTSPHQDGKLYLMNNRIKVSDDHGKTFYTMNETDKHSDNHAIAFKKNDPNYILIGTDGGIYESFDLTKTWKYVRNLPITQYFKIAVDDAAPFYNIYGGTQDNGTHKGPSRTTNRNGVRNSDWSKVLGADGAQTAVEPGNPNIAYGEFQQGVLWRIDQTTGETVFIQPQPQLGDPYERYNWDAPILVSPHNPTRLYFASQRVWRSDNRGDEWRPISSDLTKNQDRITLPIMGKQQSWDNAWDVAAMSNYNTITSLAESPKQEGLIYAGTDDGIIQVTEDGGTTWRKYNLENIKGVPDNAFVNDVRADLYEAGTVYAALDNHKYGDFKPYIIKSTNMGKSWVLINGDLPDKLLIWRLVQDHVNKNLIFAATEFGIYFTPDGGKKWIKLTGGMPNISFRDIAIQRRENDLLGGSFGRGIFVLDDISPIRDFNSSMLAAEVTLFKTKPAYWYAQTSLVGSQGGAVFTADNPPFGAVFTYYMPEKIKSLKEVRQEKEKELVKEKANIPFPGWAAIEAEQRQEKPLIILTIRDADNNIVKVVNGKNKEGFNRVSWDLSYANRSGESLTVSRRGGNFFRGGGIMATPGTYSMTLSKIVDGKVIALADPQNFEVVPLREGTLKGASYDEINTFRVSFHAFQQDLKATRNVLSNNLKTIDAMGRALSSATNVPNELVTKLYTVKMQLLDLDKAMNGDDTKGEIGERSNPTPGDAGRLGRVALGNTYGPTASHISTFKRAVDQLAQIKIDIAKVTNETIPTLEKELKVAGAPWIEGQGLIDN